MDAMVNQNGLNGLRNGLNHNDNHSDGLVENGAQGMNEMYHGYMSPSAVDDSPELDIIISNVVCSFSVKCHLNLREIALNGSNVEYRRENGLVRMKFRKPKCTASIPSSGKITCTGASSELEAKIAARRCARALQKLGFNCKITNYRIVNVLGVCTMPWNVRIESFSAQHKDIIQYEPELAPGAVYKLKDIRATARIFATGKVTITARSIGAVQAAIEHVYPLLFEFRKERSSEEQLDIDRKKLKDVQSYMSEDEEDSLLSDIN
ncbi:TATA box-binding protein-like protein 1 [Trichogramma pretiosum]|uniref:TATA box-binding protein-like protein 1 n=1 Tax=Trichogramma pretiosum TaxID=7493 RepID=UPI0006C9AF4A|nr:TATA box-binding protein-like protein 1 [Trichogramma pretiosum]